jgi:hypothetical protein
MEEVDELTLRWEMDKGNSRDLRTDEGTIVQHDESPSISSQEIESMTFQISWLGLEFPDLVAIPATSLSVKGAGRTKAFVPSRSHSSAPNKPPLTVAGLTAAPMDRLADMFRKFPDDTTHK